MNIFSPLSPLAAIVECEYMLFIHRSLKRQPHLICQMLHGRNLAEVLCCLESILLTESGNNLYIGDSIDAVPMVHLKTNPIVRHNTARSRKLLNTMTAIHGQLWALTECELNPDLPEPFSEFQLSVVLLKKLSSVLEL